MANYSTSELGGTESGAEKMKYGVAYEAPSLIQS